MIKIKLFVLLVILFSSGCNPKYLIIDTIETPFYIAMSPLLIQLGNETSKHSVEIINKLCFKCTKVNNNVKDLEKIVINWVVMILNKDCDALKSFLSMEIVKYDTNIFLADCDLFIPYNNISGIYTALVNQYNKIINALLALCMYYGRDELYNMELLDIKRTDSIWDQLTILTLNQKDIRYKFQRNKTFQTF